MTPVVFTRAGVFGTLGVVFVAAVCVRLGFWQLDRREQKHVLNVAVEERAGLPPIPLAGPPADTVGLLLRQVTVQGEYDNNRTVVLAGRSHRGIPGVHVLTPLRLAGGRGVVLVNRGWVPSPDASTVELDDYVERGPVTIQGLALPFPEGEDRVARRAAARTTSAATINTAGPTSTAAAPVADQAVTDVAATDAATDAPDIRHVWYEIDRAALTASFAYPMLDVYIQALPRDASQRLPLALPIPELDEGMHLSYAIQWFSFATIFLVGWLVVLLRRGSGAALSEPPRAGAAPPLAPGRPDP